MRGELFLRDVLVQIKRRTTRRAEPLPEGTDDDGPVASAVWPPGGL